MPEPSSSNYPTSLDDATTLGGDQLNFQQFTLDAGINAVVQTISVAESIASVNLPVYLLIDNELIWATASGSGDFTSCVRGAGGTLAAIHANGAIVYITYAANLFNQVKRALIAIETELGVNPSGTYTDVATKFSKENVLTGWNEVSDSWTYASATTITVPSDATTKYQRGWGIRWKQGAGYKYAYVTTVAATLLTVNGGTDYTVANAAITDVAISKNPMNAFGFPAYFNWNANPQGYSSVPTSAVYTFFIRGSWCFVSMLEGGNGTSNATTKVYTAPVTIAAEQYLPIPLPIDNTTNQAAGLADFVAGGTTINCYKSAAAAWTNSGGCRIVSCQGCYRY